MTAGKTIVLASNTAWSIANFRAGLIRALHKEGYSVVAVAPPDDYVTQVQSLGVRFVPIPMDNMGTNPARDVVLFLRLFILLRRERPSVFLGFTVKPNIYGGIAARLLGIAAINNVSGLGTAFVRISWLTRLVEGLYWVALSRSKKVFFQNNDDSAHFLAHGLVRESVIERLPGSGVNTDWFSPEPPRSHLKSHANERERPFRFLLSARLLWDKGVGEFVEAARRLQKEGAVAEFQLLGFLDARNRTAIPRTTLEAWVQEGVVHYLGTTRDVRHVIAQADCVVLPSYREGVPRSLLEAASMAKPLITTNAVGCRDVVDDTVNGFLCRPHDAEDLARQMRRMMALSPDERMQMGLAGRAKVVRTFNETFVIGRYLDTIRGLIEQ